MHTVIDVETIPSMDRYPFLQAAAVQFSAPSSLTKEKASEDLGLLDTKNLSKEKVIALWTERFRDEKSQQVGEDAWRATALDATKGRLISIAWKIGDDDIRGIANGTNEADLLQNAFDEMARDLGDRRPWWIGHNVTFDLKFLYRRACILNIKPPFQLPFKGRHNHEYFCTMQAWCDYREMISQAKLAEALDISTEENPITGAQVCDYWLQNRVIDILEHNMADIRECYQIFRRLLFLENSADHENIFDPTHGNVAAGAGLALPSYGF